MTETFKAHVTFQENTTEEQVNECNKIVKNILQNANDNPEEMPVFIKSITLERL